MTVHDFDECITGQVNRCLQLLVSKGNEYAPGEDRLAAFKSAAALQGSTQTQAAFGMLAKHLVSVADMIRSGRQFPEDRWDEKLGDSINYLLIIRAIIEEEASVCDISK